MCLAVPCEVVEVFGRTALVSVATPDSRGSGAVVAAGDVRGEWRCTKAGSSGWGVAGGVCTCAATSPAGARRLTE